MSDVKEAFEENMRLEKIKAETAAKQVILNSKRVNSQMEQLEQNERDLAKTKSSNFGELTPEQILDIQNSSDEYLEAAKNAMVFIHPLFDNVVPFFRKNFILIGARTGEGKSTAVANIAYSGIIRKRNTLVLTNEEKSEDFYNRVTCLENNWHYVNHNRFTTQQKNIFREMIPLWAEGGRLTVIDDNHNGSHGVTTTIEGIESVFENLIANKQHYDVVLIDYYQNISTSSKNPHMSENDVQSRLKNIMDKYKNIYPAPIVMFCQITPPDKDGNDKTPFQQRIKGRKIIMDPATCVLEMVRNVKESLTLWKIHKSRFGEALGHDIKTGYDTGRFVEYNTAFAEKVQKNAYEKKAREINEKIDKGNGLPDVFNKNATKEEK